MPFWDKLFRKKGADPMADEQQNVENTAEDTEVKVDTEAEVKAEAEAQTEGAEEKADNNSEVEALKAKAAETEDKLLRLRADFENFRRRTRQEKEELGNSVEAEFVKNLLPLIDNFERAMAADTTDVTFADILNMEKTLEKKNVYGDIKFIVSPDAKYILRNTAVGGTKSDFKMIMSDGEIDGIPTLCTNAVASKGIILGNFNDLVIGQWGGINR